MIPPRGSVLTTEVRSHDDGHGYYVFWETGTAYGARGYGLTKEAADDLARRLLVGEEKP